MTRQLWLRLHGWLFTVLLLAVLGGIAWATASLPQAWQWGGALGRTLSPPSQRLLAALDAEVVAYGFAQPGQLLYRHLDELLGLYQAQSPRFRVSLVNPETRPDLVRELGVERAGEVVLEYAGQRERVPVPSEAHVSAALERLLRDHNQFIAFLTGHGERSLLGAANHDLGVFGEALQRKGYRLQPLNLIRLQEIPDNTALLLLTPPQTALLPGERGLLRDYVERGGSMLWLGDPDEQAQLEFLAETIGLRWRPGVVLDPQAAAALATDDSRLVLIDDYPRHAATAQLRAPVLLVQAAAMEPPVVGWDVAPLLAPAASQVLVERYPDGAPQPVTGAALGLALSRQQGERRQRIVVVGDGDFLANSYIGNGANLPLGLNLVDWLTESELFLDSFARPAADQLIELSRWQIIVLAAALLLALPLSFLTAAAASWWRRRRG
ncbi:MAG TPA: GldG family protein [Gammaproteobacteria bacterium]|nr:GldG family protein [Gammaproteobacteria bacterium]